MKLLYKTPLPEVAQPGESDQQSSQLAESGVLDGDDSIVEQLSSDPGQVTLSGRIQFGDPHSQMVAEELEELSGSSIDNVPLFRSGDRDWGGRGYYEVQSADVEPVHTNRDEVYEYDLSLSKQGTRSNYYRGVETNPRQADHEFGNDTDALVAAPAAARKVQWFDGEAGGRARAEPTETRPAEFADVDIYDLEDGEDALDIEDAPTLVYEIDYADEAPADCAVYDTLGTDEKYISNDDGRVRVWQSLFSTQHDFDDEIVMDNGLVRLRLDETEGTIAAEEWDDSAEEWTDVGLDQPADVELWDVDLQEVAMVRDKCQLTFDVDGSLFALDAILSRGADGVVFDIPSSVDGPIPVEIEDWIEPIAAGELIDPQAAKALAPRNDVRR